MSLSLPVQPSSVRVELLRLEQDRVAEAIWGADFKKKVTHRMSDGISVVEGYWKPANRYVRLFSRVNKKSVNTVIGMIRGGMFTSVSTEVELVMRKMALNSGQKEAKTRSHASLTGFELESFLTQVSQFLVSDAESACSSCPAGAPPSCYASQSRCTQREMQASLNGLHREAGSLNGKADEGLGIGSRAAGEFSSTSALALSAMPGAMDNATRFNDSFERLVNTAETFTDPDKVAILSGAAAAGATLGAMAVASSVSLAAAAGSALYEAITHEKDEAKRLDAFVKAREQWESQKKVALEAEKAIDAVLAMQSLAFAQNRSIDQLKQDVGVWKALYEGELTGKKKRLADASSDGSVSRDCRFAMAKEVMTAEEGFRAMSVLGENLEKARPAQAICDQMQNALTKLIGVEANLQRLRIEMLNGIDVRAKQWNDEGKEQGEKLSRFGQEVSDASKLLGNGGSDGDIDKSLGKLERGYEARLSNCMGQIGGVDTVFDGTLRENKEKGRCIEALKSDPWVVDHYQREKDQLELLRIQRFRVISNSTNELRVLTPRVGVDVGLRTKEIEEELKFFTTLAKEQSCGAHFTDCDPVDSPWERLQDKSRSLKQACAKLIGELKDAPFIDVNPN